MPLHKGSYQTARAPPEAVPPACSPLEDHYWVKNQSSMSAARCGEEALVAEMGVIQLAAKGFEGL